MPTFEIVNDVSILSSVRHAAQAATANGTSVDLAGYEAAVALLNVAALGGTTPAATYQLQESADDVTYTAVAAADLVAPGGGAGAQPAAFTAAGLTVLGYRGSKRYLRWALTALTGTSPTVTATAEIIRGIADHVPAGSTQTP
jgi:hypothetical protein